MRFILKSLFQGVKTADELFHEIGLVHKKDFKKDPRQAKKMLEEMRFVAPNGFILTVIPTSSINMRDPTVWKVKQGKIDEYAHMNPETAPPIIVTQKGYNRDLYFSDLLPGASRFKYSVIDGNHRLNAALIHGVEEIQAYVPK